MTRKLEVKIISVRGYTKEKPHRHLPDYGIEGKLDIHLEFDNLGDGEIWKLALIFTYMRKKGYPYRLSSYHVDAKGPELHFVYAGTYELGNRFNLILNYIEVYKDDILKKALIEFYGKDKFN